MKLDEAKEILKRNGYLLEDAMHDRAMSRVKRAYQDQIDRQNPGGDPMAIRHHSEDWEEGGHTEWDETDKAYSDRNEMSDFAEEVTEKLVEYFKPIYAKLGFTAAVFKKDNGTTEDWDWAIRDIIGNFMSHAVRDGEKLSFMSVDEAFRYMLPKVAKALKKCWSKKSNWFDPYVFEYPEKK